MEYHCSDDKGVASRIFEKGMDTYGDEIEFVLRYLGFLISINDKNSAYLFTFLFPFLSPLFFFPSLNSIPVFTRIGSVMLSCHCHTNLFIDARALFERVIPTFPPERARPLWERWARYEYQYGDLEAALKLEKRMAEVYPSGWFIFRLVKDFDADDCLFPQILLSNDSHKDIFT